MTDSWLSKPNNENFQYLERMFDIEMGPCIMNEETDFLDCYVFQSLNVTYSYIAC